MAWPVSGSGPAARSARLMARLLLWVFAAKPPRARFLQDLIACHQNLCTKDYQLLNIEVLYIIEGADECLMVNYDLC